MWQQRFGVFSVVLFGLQLHHVVAVRTALKELEAGLYRAGLGTEVCKWGRGTKPR